MSYLKKYFTEGLIQVAILLSLCGVRVDVGPHLPTWQEMIQGPSTGLTQTQFHNLRNRLDGHGLHPKSVDLDEFFTARRLLGWVRSLDRLQVPGAELETWLVHRETEVLAGGPGQPSALQGPGTGLTDLGDQNEEGSPLRSSTVGVGSGSSYGSLRGNVPHEVMPTLTWTQEEEGSDDVTTENPTDTLRPARLDHFPDQAFEHGHHPRSQQTPLVPLDEEGEEEEEEEELARVNWREEERSYDHVNRELAQELSEQYASLEAQTSLSLRECLQLLEDNFPFGQEPQLPEEEDQDLREARLEELTPGREPLLSPLLTHEDPSLDLEQQWQDLLAIMEPEDMDVDSAVALSLPGSSTDDAIQRSSAVEHHPSPVHQDVSLHQAFLPRDSQESYHPLSPPAGGSDPQEPPYQPQLALLTLPNSTPHNLNISFQTQHLRDYSSEENGTEGEPMTSDLFAEDSVLPSPLGSLLEDTTMFDEISLLDLALEEGFSPELASRLEEGFNPELVSPLEEGFSPELASRLENELDSDSGLSLNFSHSPASPSGSEASYSSSSSSSSSSSFSSVSTAASSLSEDGAVGYNSDMEAVVEEDEEEEGAVGGYSTDVRKICSMSYQDPERFNHLPWLEHVDHDHTYNQQWSTSPSPGKTPRNLKSQHTKPYEPDVTDKMWSRDERRARALKIPFSNERIVNLPVEDFNTLLTKHRLTDAQLSLVRDIRRRGKNKMAAQNCRRRKLDVLLDLEQGVSVLRRQRARLLKERTEGLRSIQEMKQRVSGLYQEVFSRLRDEDGRPLAAEEYSLQFGNDGRVLVNSGGQGSASESNHRPSKKQKDRKK